MARTEVVTCDMCSELIAKGAERSVDEYENKDRGARTWTWELCPKCWRTTGLKRRQASVELG